MEAGAAGRCVFQRQVVGGLQRSGAERAGRAGRDHQPERGAGRSAVPAGEGGGPRGARGAVPHRRALVGIAQSVSGSVGSVTTTRLAVSGTRLNLQSPRRRFLGARPLGQHPPRRHRGRGDGAILRGGAGKRAPAVSSGAGAGLLSAARHGRRRGSAETHGSLLPGIPDVDAEPLPRRRRIGPGCRAGGIAALRNAIEPDRPGSAARAIRTRHRDSDRKGAGGGDHSDRRIDDAAAARARSGCPRNCWSGGRISRPVGAAGGGGQRADRNRDGGLLSESDVSGSTGLQDSSLAKLDLRPSGFWSVGAQLAETLFDAGRRRAVVVGQQAAYDATVAAYRETVLTALQQVEDNLAALRILETEAAKVQQTDSIVRSRADDFDRAVPGRNHELSYGAHVASCGSERAANGGGVAGAAADGQRAIDRGARRRMECVAVAFRANAKRDEVKIQPAPLVRRKRAPAVSSSAGKNDSIAISDTVTSSGVPKTVVVLKSLRMPVSVVS